MTLIVVQYEASESEGAISVRLGRLVTQHPAPVSSVSSTSEKTMAALEPEVLELADDVAPAKRKKRAAPKDALPKKSRAAGPRKAHDPIQIHARVVPSPTEWETYRDVRGKHNPERATVVGGKSFDALEVRRMKNGVVVRVFDWGNENKSIVFSPSSPDRVVRDGYAFGGMMYGFRFFVRCSVDVSVGAEYEFHILNKMNVSVASCKTSNLRVTMRGLVPASSNECCSRGINVACYMQNPLE